MNLKEYKNMSWEHLAHIKKMRLLVYYSMKHFKDFPKKMDKDLKKELHDGLGHFKERMEKILNDEDIEDSEECSLKLDPSYAVFNETFFIISSEVNRRTGGAKNVLNFNDLILCQALVMNYARIDAFLNESIGCVCDLNPEIMINFVDNKTKKNIGSNEKNISWKEIIKLGSYENIMNNIKEEFIYKLGQKSLKNRVCFLEEKLGYNFKSNKIDIDLELIFKGEQYRHSIVHRGGIVDERLLATCSESKINKGDKIKIDEKFISEVYEESIKFITIILNETIKKYFNKDEGHIEINSMDIDRL